MDGEEDTDNYSYIGTSHGSNHVTIKRKPDHSQLNDARVVMRKPGFSFLIKYYNLLYQSLMPNCKLTIKILKPHLEIPSDVESFILNGESSRISCQRIINLLLVELDITRDYKQFCHLFNLISVMTDLTDKLRAEFHHSSYWVDDITQNHYCASCLTGSDVYYTSHTAHSSKVTTTSNTNRSDNCAEEDIINRCVDDGPSDGRADNYSITSHHQVVGRRCRSSLVPAESVTQRKLTKTSSTQSSLDHNFSTTSNLVITESVTSIEPKITDTQPAHTIVESTHESCAGSTHSLVNAVDLMQVVSDTTDHTDVSDIQKASHSDKTLSRQLDKVVTSLGPDDLKATLSTLVKIFDNIAQHPNDDKYRQIKLANKRFSNKVWRHRVCEELMKMSGWVVEDDHVRLKDESCVHVVSQLLVPLWNKVRMTDTVSTPSSLKHSCPTGSNREGEIPDLGCGNTKSDIFEQIVNLFALLSEPDFKNALTVLNDIYQNIIHHGKDKQYYQIKLTDEAFNNKVWRHPVCQRFMEMNGWIVEDDHVRLGDDSHAHIVAQHIAYFCQENDTTENCLHSTQTSGSSSSEQITVAIKPISDLIVSSIFSGNAFQVKVLLDFCARISSVSFVKQIHVSLIIGTSHTVHPARLITTGSVTQLDNCAEDNVIIRCVDDGPLDDKADNYSVTSHHQVVGRKCRSNLFPAESVTQRKLTQMSSTQSSLEHFCSTASDLLLKESVIHTEPQQTDTQPAHLTVKEPHAESTHSCVNATDPMLVVSNTTSTDVSDIQKALDFDNILSMQLDKIVTCLSLKDLKATLPILTKIFDNIVHHPNDDKYCQIKLTNKTFSNKVWRYPPCEELMKMSGWVVEDDHVRLRDDSCIRVVSRLLEPLYNRVKMAETVSIESSLNHSYLTSSNRETKDPDLGDDNDESDILDQVVSMFAMLSTADYKDALAELNNIYQNVIQHDKDKRYYQLKLTDETFINKVWRHPACQSFMEMNGWVEENDHVTLRDDSRIHIVAQHLTHLFEIKHTRDSCLKSTLSDESDTSCYGSTAVLPKPLSNVVINVIFSGSAYQVKELLDHCATLLGASILRLIHVSWIVGSDRALSLIDVAYVARQIGIARILVDEYSMDPNGIGKRRPNFGRLFLGSDSSEACQSLIIEFIKEFKLEVGLCDTVGSAIHYAVLYKLFTVLKFLVENCKVNVNQAVFVGQYNGATALHIAFGLNDTEMANYLIQHGADENLIDYNGKRPRDYLFGNEDDTYCSLSTRLINASKLYRDIKSKEYQYYHLLLERGTNCWNAVDLTFQKYPELNDDVTPTQPFHNLEITPTMRELNHYITDMAPTYYSIGLELGIHNKQLKVIKNDPSLFNIKHKCRTMLEMWLDTDTSASWRKLCEVLQEPEVGLCNIAEQIKKYLEAI